MQKGIIKAIVLSVIFFVSVAVFSIVTNQVNEDLTTEMADASLPVLSLYSENTEINELRGYTTEMNAAFMRDTITPIADDRILPVKINTFFRNGILLASKINSRLPVSCSNNCLSELLPTVIATRTLFLKILIFFSFSSLSQ